MSSKLERTTFTITQNQIRWLAEQSEKTGLNKVEIVRRALDEYSEREEAKAEHQLFYNGAAGRNQGDRTREGDSRIGCRPSCHRPGTQPILQKILKYGDPKRPTHRLGKSG